MKKTILLLSLFTLAACTTPYNESSDERTASTTPAKASLNDFAPLSNKQWSGSLSYLDYSGNGKRYTIPTKATVSLKSPSTVSYAITFPEEPHMNSESELAISANGMKVDGATISKQVLNSDGSLELTTETLGQDNGQAATIRTTYIISEEEFVIRKDFKLPEASGFTNRNEFVFGVE